MQSTIRCLNQRRTREGLTTQLFVQRIFVVQWFDNGARQKQVFGLKKEWIFTISSRLEGGFTAVSTINQQRRVKEVLYGGLPRNLKGEITL